MPVLEDHHVNGNKFGLAEGHLLAWTTPGSEREHVAYLLISWLPMSASLPLSELT